MSESDYNNIYLQQVAQFNKDAQLQRIVTMLQGIAALVTIIFVTHQLMQSK